MSSRRYQTGAEKRAKDRKRKLEQAAHDPKQGKLCFGANSGVVVSSPSDGDGNVNSTSTSPEPVTSASTLETEVADSLDVDANLSPSPLPPDCDDAAAADVTNAHARDSALLEFGGDSRGCCNDVDAGTEPVPETAPAPAPTSTTASASGRFDDDDDDSSAGNVNVTSTSPSVDLVYFVIPSEDSPLSVKKAFVANHPVQPTPSVSEKFPFDTAKAYYKHVGTEVVQRTWLSYCKHNSSLYCAPCMAFAPRTHGQPTSSFVTGINTVGKKDTYKSISRHEESKSHLEACNAYVTAALDKDVTSLIDTELVKTKDSQRDFKRKVVERIIDICIFIGRQGLAYRGKEEAAHSLDNRNANHGNFLELVLLLAEYDPVLKEHVRLCIDHSMKRRAKRKQSKSSHTGRGSFVSFLSKTSVNKLIRIIGSEIQMTILKDVKKAKLFSLQIDSTTDVGVLDQLAIVVRYVTATGVKERLIRLTVSHDNTGEGLFNLVKHELEKLGLSLDNLVACSFDGASNMSGCYKGLQARLKEVNPDLVFTHCAAHCLNLVISDTCKNCTEVQRLFGLVETGAVFISDSYKRTAVWSKIVGRSSNLHDKLRRLQKVNATRWWSKDKALASILDAEIGDEIPPSRILDFLTCMNEIRESSSFDDKARFGADCIIKSWTRFETIVTALLMQDIFQKSTPVSEALQSVNLDYLATFRMVENLLSTMRKKRDEFDIIVDRAKKYVEAINEQMDLKGIDIQISTEFQPIRTTRNSTVAVVARGRSRGTRGHRQETEAEQNQRQIKESQDFYKVNTYFTALDNMIVGLTARFIPNEGLLKDCAALDPKRFTELKGVNVIADRMDTIAKLAKLDASALRSELISYAENYSNLLQSVFEEESSDELDADSEDEIGDNSRPSEDGHGESVDEGDGDGETVIVKCKACKHCLSCAFQTFTRFPFLRGTYPSLYAAYKYVLTLPTTQVSCERVFSKVKFIKTRLRSLLSQELFEPLIFISVENQLAITLDKHVILKKFAESSSELLKLLL